MFDDADDDRFSDELQVVAPYLRSFALRLCQDAILAEDLTQEALLKAWRYRRRFILGTNIRAWTTVILRNTYLEGRKRAWRVVELDPDVAGATLLAVTSDTAALELNDLRCALQNLTQELREALILVGAGGLSYQEAADLSRVAIGTMKSRVYRGRVRLKKLVEDGVIRRDATPAGSAMGLIQREVSAALEAHAI